MNGKKTTWRRRVTAVVTALVMTSFVIVFSPPGADAYCDVRGGGTHITKIKDIISVDGRRAGREEARYSSTCDGDGYYAGRVRNYLGKSTTVYVWSNGRYVPLATSRDSAGYRFQIVSSSSSVGMALTNAFSPGRTTFTNRSF